VVFLLADKFESRTQMHNGRTQLRIRRRFTRRHWGWRNSSSPM